MHEWKKLPKLWWFCVLLNQILFKTILEIATSVCLHMFWVPDIAYYTAVFIVPLKQIQRPKNDLSNWSSTEYCWPTRHV